MGLELEWTQSAINSQIIKLWPMKRLAQGHKGGGGEGAGGWNVKPGPLSPNQVFLLLDWTKL